MPGTIPCQGPRHTNDVINMVPVVSSLSTERSKAKILALSQELRYENHVIGKIWYRNPSKSEVIGGDEKNE